MSLHLKAVYLMLFLFSLSAFAEGEFNVYVHTFDRNMDTSTINEKEIKKTVGPGKLKDNTRDLPSPAMMNGMFLEAGLEKEVKKMDQIEKDLLFMKVWKKPLSFVLAHYSHIEEKKIIKLKKIIEKRQ